MSTSETDEAEEASGARLPPAEGPRVLGAVPGVSGAGQGVGIAEEGVHAHLHKVQPQPGRPRPPFRPHHRHLADKLVLLEWFKLVYARLLNG